MRVSRRVFLLLGSFSCEISYAWLRDFINISLQYNVRVPITADLKALARRSHEAKDFTNLRQKQSPLCAVLYHSITIQRIIKNNNFIYIFILLLDFRIDINIDNVNYDDTVQDTALFNIFYYYCVNLLHDYKLDIIYQHYMTTIVLLIFNSFILFNIIIKAYNDTRTQIFIVLLLSRFLEK